MISSKKDLEWDKYNWLLDMYKEDCISQEKDKKCYKKPCACLVCLNQDSICMHDNPCHDCNGEDNKRRYEFCFLRANIE